MKNLRVLSFVFLIVMALFTSGCGDSRRQVEINAKTTAATNAVAQLKRDLDGGLIRNAIVLKQYASMLKTQRPELGQLMDSLALDTTSNGPMFKLLSNRLAAANPKAMADGNYESLVSELDSIASAAKPVIYNNALTDPVNVIADMSDGKLARVATLTKTEEENALGKSGQLGSGSQLVGNPTYGHWSTRSDGTSFWMWYAMYSMFSSGSGNHVIMYDSWNRNRPYSYYNDHWRNDFGTRAERTQNVPSFSRTADAKTYGTAMSTVRKPSTFSAPKTVSPSSSFAGTGSKMDSSFSKKMSSFSGSVRSSGLSTGRSIHFGK